MVGTSDGETLGNCVGTSEGLNVGISDGTEVGSRLGTCEVEGAMEGDSEQKKDCAQNSDGVSHDRVFQCVDYAMRNKVHVRELRCY